MHAAFDYTWLEIQEDPTLAVLDYENDYTNIDYRPETGSRLYGRGKQMKTIDTTVDNPYFIKEGPRVREHLMEAIQSRHVEQKRALRQNKNTAKIYGVMRCADPSHKDIHYSMKRMDDSNRMRTKRQGSSNEYQRHMYRTTYQRQMRDYEQRRQEKMAERARVADFKKDLYNHKSQKQQLLVRAHVDRENANNNVDSGGGPPMDGFDYKPETRMSTRRGS